MCKATVFYRTASLLTVEPTNCITTGCYYREATRDGGWSSAGPRQFVSAVHSKSSRFLQKISDLKDVIEQLHIEHMSLDQKLKKLSKMLLEVPRIEE